MNNYLLNQLILIKVKEVKELIQINQLKKKTKWVVLLNKFKCSRWTNNKSPQPPKVCSLNSNPNQLRRMASLPQYTWEDSMIQWTTHKICSNWRISQAIVLWIVPVDPVASLNMGMVRLIWVRGWWTWTGQWIHWSLEGLINCSSRSLLLIALEGTFCLKRSFRIRYPRTFADTSNMSWANRVFSQDFPQERIKCHSMQHSREQLTTRTHLIMKTLMNLTWQTILWWDSFLSMGFIQEYPN